MRLMAEKPCTEICTRTISRIKWREFCEDVTKVQRNDAIIMRASRDRRDVCKHLTSCMLFWRQLMTSNKACVSTRSMLRTPGPGYKVVTNLVLLHMKNMDTRLNAEYALGLKPSCIFCVQTRVHIFHMSQHSVSNLYIHRYMHFIHL